jgi:hypothetical protein
MYNHFDVNLLHVFHNYSLFFNMICYIHTLHCVRSRQTNDEIFGV